MQQPYQTGPGDLKWTLASLEWGLGWGGGVADRQEQGGLPGRALGSECDAANQVFILLPFTHRPEMGDSSLTPHSPSLLNLLPCPGNVTSEMLHKLIYSSPAPPPSPSSKNLRMKINFFNKAISTVSAFLSVQSLFSFWSQDLCTCYFSSSSPLRYFFFPFLFLVSLH